MARQFLQKWYTTLHESLENVSFIHLHYFYFCAACILSSIIFWGSSTPAKSVRFIDSLFLCVSAMTEAGKIALPYCCSCHLLMTFQASTPSTYQNCKSLGVEQTLQLHWTDQLFSNTWQQVILFILIIAGSAIFVSIAILHVRKRAFEKKFAELAERRRRLLLRPRSLTFTWSRRRPSHSGDREAAIASGAVRGRAIPDRPQDDSAEDKASLNPPERTQSPSNVVAESDTAAISISEVANDEQNGHIRFRDQLPAAEHAQNHLRPRNISRRRTSFLEGRGVGARPLDNHPRNALPRTGRYSPDGDNVAVEDDIKSQEKGHSKLSKYLDTVNGYLGRNSQFHGLSEKERKKLGGIEYDAICLLSWVVPLYFFLFQLFGALGLGAWIKVNRPGMALRNGTDERYLLLKDLADSGRARPFLDGCLLCCFSVQQLRNGSVGCQRDCAPDELLLLAHFESAHSGRKHLLPAFPQANLVDDEENDTKQVPITSLATTPSNVGILPRPSSTSLHQPVSRCADMVAGFLSGNAERH